LTHHKPIKIGRKIEGFMCGSFGCIPFIGPMEELPEDFVIQEKSLKEQIDEAVLKIKQMEQERGE
jgi:hypothetical protein